MTTVWFIRHGESESNAGLVTSAPGNSRLTPRGQAEAACIPAAFRERPSLIVTSPYLRTKQTAQPTIERFPETPQAEWPVHEFTYIAASHYLNTTARQRAPLLSAFWERCDPDYCDGEGAESFAALLARVRQTLDAIAQIDGGFVAIFSHGLFVRALIWSLMARATPEASPDAMRRFHRFITGVKMPNGAILPLRVEPTGEFWFNRFVTEHLNDEAMRR